MKHSTLELPNIWYDIEHLKKMAQSIPSYNWYSFSCNNIRWTVKEKIKRYRLECKNIEPDPFFDDLFKFFKGNLSYDRMLFSKTPPPGVPKHVDRTRQTIINFPILGTFHDSPQSFWLEFDSAEPTSQFFYKKNSQNFYYPIVFDGQAIHSVENEGDEDRTILSVWFDVPFTDLDIDSLIDKTFKSNYIKYVF